MKIAIVEDDINMRKSLELALAEYPKFSIKTFKNAKDALAGIDESFELIVTDITMPGMNGIEFIKNLQGNFEIIVITGNATLGSAIESVRLGVKDFITKPFEIDTLVRAIERSQKIKEIKQEISDRMEKGAIEKRGSKDKDVNKKEVSKKDISRQNIKDSFLFDAKNTKDDNKDDKDDKDKFFQFASKKLQDILNLAKKAALTDVSILLIGESGVGKELFAKFIHQNSKRLNQPFVAINMAAIPENLLESELFGYEKGAFTDATTPKQGLFESAQGGTLFLDEIGEMPISLQAKILRVLQEKEVFRVGSTKSYKIDVRIISATNANLNQKIENKEFRQDLYYRLNTVPLLIPPLRERKEEILPIAKEMLTKTIENYGFEEKEFSESATKMLLQYDWPGNVRELLSVVERSVILSQTAQIQKEDLFLESRIGG